LKEPLYIFLVQIFQHLSPVSWWEDFIVPVMQREYKGNFKYLDISELLNVFKINLSKILKYLRGKGEKYDYDEVYQIVNKVHKIRNLVAHANDIEMSSFILVESLTAILDFSRLINVREDFIQKLESDWLKNKTILPEKEPKTSREEKVRNSILAVIEEKVLLKAVNCESLPTDIKLSVDRTNLRLHSMRTLDEITGFFNNAMRSECGLVVEKALHEHGLYSFEDIKDEVNSLTDLP
jgi:hypothetical protein